MTVVRLHRPAPKSGLKHHDCKTRMMIPSSPKTSPVTPDLSLAFAYPISAAPGWSGPPRECHALAARVVASNAVSPGPMLT